MTKKAEQDAKRSEAIAKLLKLVKPGDRVYCVLRSRSSSGMSRVIDLMIPYQEMIETYPFKAGAAGVAGERDYTAKPNVKPGPLRIRSIGYLAAQAMGDSWDGDKGGARVKGYGMDMGFSQVYDLGRTLWPDGTPEPHSTRNGEPDSDGGYALKHEWL